MKKSFKYLSFIFLIIPVVLLFAGCKKDETPVVNSYSFSITSEDGIKFADANGNNLSDVKKLETDGDTTYFVQVRNDKDASNIKVYVNDVEQTLSSVSTYNDEIVDGTNYQNVYSFVVGKVSADTSIKVEGTTDKLITFEFDVASGDEHYDEKAKAIANNILIETYDELEYDHTQFDKAKTITLRDFIDNNKKITIPYKNIVDTTINNFKYIYDLNYLRLTVENGLKVYSTTVQTEKNLSPYFSPFEVLKLNSNNTIYNSSVLAFDQGLANGLSSVVGSNDNFTNCLLFNLGNLKTDNFLKKTNVYTLSFKNTDFSSFTVGNSVSSGLESFVSYSTTESAQDSNKSHTYNNSTEVTVTLDYQKVQDAFGDNANTFLSNLQFKFIDKNIEFAYSNFNDNVYKFTINPTDLPNSARSFTLEYSLKSGEISTYSISVQAQSDKTDKDTRSEELSFLRSSITISTAIGEIGTATPNIAVANKHYSIADSLVTITINKELFEEKGFDISKLTLTFDGEPIELTEESVYTFKLVSTDKPSSGSTYRLVAKFVD